MFAARSWKARNLRKHFVANLHYLIVFFCLAYVFAFGASNLRSDPIKTADYNSLKHLEISYRDPLWSLPQTINSVAERSSDHAPLYFILLNLWAQLTGRDLVTLRALSLFFALLALAFTFRLALSTSGPIAALNAALLTSFLAYFLYYSLEARMYSLLIACAAWVVWAYWRVAISRAETRQGHWAALIFGAAAVINVHYIGFLVLAAIGLYHLLFARKSPRWLHVCLAMCAAGLSFLPWLPVALGSFSARSIPDHDVLTLLEAIPAILSPYSNGLLLPWLIGGALLALSFRRLRQGERYIVWVAAILLVAILLANEFADLIIARRLRYTIALMPLWNCSLAIGLRLLPRWRILRIPALALWMMAGLIYNSSSDMLLYTNRLADGQERVPPFQRLLYDSTIDVQKRDVVVGVHADRKLEFKQFDFYSGKLGRWDVMIHMWRNEQGELEMQFNDTRYPNLEALVRWDYPIWLVYDPSQTELAAMDLHSDALLRHFQLCQRTVDLPDAAVELYLAKDILCELYLAERPRELVYAGGNRLENIAAAVNGDALRLSFLWAEIVQNEYAFSLQVFDQNGPTGLQIDDVIAGAPVHNYALDLSALPPGDYVANLIVYGFETGESQAGLIVESQERFQREVAVARFTIDG